jgi:hypothetical protein
LVLSCLRGDARSATTETSFSYPISRPRFRKVATARPEGLLASHRETCASFSNVGFCVKYQIPVESVNLCGGYVSILKVGKWQWVRP